MNKNRLAELVHELKDNTTRAKRARSTFSFRLDIENVKILQEYSKSKGLNASSMLDAILARFIEELGEQNELPVHHQKHPKKTTL